MLIVLAGFALVANAGDVVTVTISDGVENPSLKAKMERLMSTLFTEANAAREAQRAMNYASLGVNDDVKTKLSMLWDNSPFVCLDTEIVEHCISTSSGYQVRNLPLQLVEEGEGNDYQEAVVSFDKQGNMTNFQLAISTNLYMNVIRSNSRVVGDLLRRQLILDYVEQFRTAYNQKDLKFLEDIFSDDALIITGHVIKRKKDGVKLPDKIEYTKHTKRQYLDKLKGIFGKNKKIRVTFDEIEVMLHPLDTDVYGVTLHQGYTSDSYHDDGYLFLLWDFKDETHPQIHVRTWQPDAYDKDGTGVKQRIPKSEVFSLSDFDI